MTMTEQRPWTIERLIDEKMPPQINQWAISWTQRPGDKCDAHVWWNHNIASATGRTAFEALDAAISKAIKLMRPDGWKEI